MLASVLLIAVFLLGTGYGAKNAYISTTAVGDIADKYMYKYCLENKVDDCGGKYLQSKGVSLPIDLYIYPNDGEVYIVSYGSSTQVNYRYRIDVRWDGKVLGEYKFTDKEFSL
jgi:hypothetical protein